MIHNFFYNLKFCNTKFVSIFDDLNCFIALILSENNGFFILQNITQ